MRNVFLVACLTVWHFIGPLTGQALASDSDWELTPPAADALPVSAERRLAGIYPAGSHIKDDKAPGGFGPCDNWPKDLGAKKWGKDEVISLIAFPDEPVAYFKSRGIALRLINRTGEVAAFSACDSKLYIVQEALDEGGHWREIEDEPCTFCGNSFHRVFLKSGQYWEFKARSYGGTISTKIRFRLDPSGRAKPIYSNAFDGQVAKVQFRKGPTGAELRRALRSNDPMEEGVIATLIEVLGTEDVTRSTGPRLAATNLASFGPAAKEALPALRAAMESKNLEFRATAAYAVWRVDGKADAPVKTLIGVLSARDRDRSCCEAASLLNEMGPAAKDAVPALCEALANGDEVLRTRAAHALSAIRSNADVAVPALTKAMGDQDCFVRSSAGQALGEYGAHAKTAIPVLVKALDDENGRVKVAAALALYHIEDKTETAVPALIEILNSKNDHSYAPNSAAEALGKIGPPAKEAVPHLTAALGKHKRGLRISAAGALWKITKRSDVALPILIKAVEDDDPDDPVSESSTQDAIKTLEDMGSQAKAAVPALLAARARTDGSTRDMLERVLKKIDPEATKKVTPR